MYQQRREFIRSFTELGAMSAAMVAMATAGRARAATSPRTAVGDAIRGPYLDLTTPRGNMIAFARMNGDLDESKQKNSWYKGWVMAVRPDRRTEDLVGFEGFDSSRLRKRADGSFEKLLREIVLYTDLKTGEVLEEWHNPYINETVKVVPITNDPYNYLIEEYARRPPSYARVSEEEEGERPPFLLDWYQHGNRLDVERHVHFYYPNRLKPEKWVRESSGPMVRVTAMYTFNMDAGLMQDESVTTLPYSGAWHRIAPWPPWMLMGQTAGFCQFASFHGSGEELDQVLSRNALDHVEKHYPRFLQAPDKWQDVTRTSLENYAIEQEPAPVKR